MIVGGILIAVLVTLLLTAMAIMVYLLRRKNRFQDYLERGLVATVTLVEQYAESQKTHRNTDVSELQKLFPMK